MRFSVDSYNRSQFNVGGDAESSGLRGMSKSRGQTLPAVLLMRVRLAGAAASVSAAPAALLAVRVPICAESVGTGRSKPPLLCMRVPLHAAAQGAAQTPPPMLDIAKTDYMQFVGVNLRPGETLYIDTDLIRILRNGEDDIRGWSGGMFFKLSPSGNILTYSDNAASRQLQASVVWQDRWL